MFYIFNKDKLVSYVITVFTVIALFLTASIFKPQDESVQTSANESKINTIQNNEEKNNVIPNNEIIIEN